MKNKVRIKKWGLILIFSSLLLTEAKRKKKKVPTLTEKQLRQKINCHRRGFVFTESRPHICKDKNGGQVPLGVGWEHMDDVVEKSSLVNPTMIAPNGMKVTVPPMQRGKENPEIDAKKWGNIEKLLKSNGFGGL